MTRPWRIALKMLLAAVTLVAMLSYGGLLIFLFLPLGVGMWWAPLQPHRERRLGRVGGPGRCRVGVADHVSRN
jgi:hypothetical protein